MTAYMFIWGWRDCIEVLFLVTVLYKITLWLNKDTTRKLVWYLYGYCALILVCYALSLSLLATWLIVIAPVAAILCVLMHQDMLQKRFAVPVKIIPAQLSTQWVDELLQALLIIMNSKKQVLCVVEYKDLLNNLIETACPLSSACKKSVLVMLADSTLFAQQDLIWISVDGMIKGINCRWVQHEDDAAKDSWAYAVTVCTKTDALVCRANPERNNFDIVVHGKVIEHLSSSNCRSILLQYVSKFHLTEKNQINSAAHYKEKAYEDNHA